ncbi:MAG: type II secretion system protein [Bacillota bacterium]|nr:type II secretion system protein [Bacillota bacterium]
MKHIKGIITNGRSRGYSLVEVITAISIMCIIMSSVLSIFINISRSYKKEVTENREEFYIGEALRYMENEISKGNEKISITSNVIELTRPRIDSRENEIDYIKKDGSRLVVECTKNGYYMSTDVFLRDISEFTINRANNVILIDIVSSKGKRYRKCIDTQYIV